MGFRAAAISLMLAAGAVVAAGTALAEAPQSRGAKAVATRQANMKQLGGSFKAISDELKKAAPDTALLAEKAAKVKALAGDLPDWFPKGSGPEASPKTEAKATIWTDAVGFAGAANRAQVETSKLQQLAAAGNWDGFKAQARATGGSCKNCHDKFREEKDKAKAKT